MPPIAVADVTLEVRDEGQGSPVLLLHGIPTRNVLWKRVIPPLVAGGYRAIAELLGAELKLLPGGHFLPPDRPEEIAQAIVRFAGALGPRS